MSQKSSFRLNCQKQKNTAKKIIKHKNFQPLDGPTLQKCAKKMLNNHKVCSNKLLSISPHEF